MSTSSSAARSSRAAAPSSRTSSRRRATRRFPPLLWEARANGADRIRDRPGNRLRLRDQVRLLRSGGLLLQVGPRALARARRRDLLAQEGAGVDAEVPPPLARLLLCPPDADLG